MSTTAERAGPAFTVEGMERARAETRKAIAAIAARIRPGCASAPMTMKPMKEASAPGVVLGANDIVFIDTAPRVEHWEGDGGATFVAGDGPAYVRWAADAERLFHEVRTLSRVHKPTGGQGYEFATLRAREMAWILNMDLPGHRVSDFPHAAIHTGALADYQESPSSVRWMLEIHLTDPQARFGALFEDMLLEDGDDTAVPA